jgi:hypothetical protein
MNVLWSQYRRFGTSFRGKKMNQSWSTPLVCGLIKTGPHYYQAAHNELERLLKEEAEIKSCPKFLCGGDAQVRDRLIFFPAVGIVGDGINLGIKVSIGPGQEIEEKERAEWSNVPRGNYDAYDRVRLKFDDIKRPENMPRLVRVALIRDVPDYYESVAEWVASAPSGYEKRTQNRVKYLGPVCHQTVQTLIDEVNRVKQIIPKSGECVQW